MCEQAFEHRVAQHAGRSIGAAVALLQSIGQRGTHAVLLGMTVGFQSAMTCSNDSFQLGMGSRPADFYTYKEVTNRFDFDLRLGQVPLGSRPISRR